MMKRFWDKNGDTIKKVFWNKYGITLLVFFFIFVFFSEHNLISRWKNSREIHRLENEIEYYENQIRKDKKEIKKIQSGNDRLEKYGREKFYLKKEGEDIFIIEEENE